MVSAQMTPTNIHGEWTVLIENAIQLGRFYSQEINGMVKPWASIGTEEENFWKRFYQVYIRGDLIEYPENPIIYGDNNTGRGIYYTHYKIGTEVHLIVAYNASIGGKIQIGDCFLTENEWNRVKILKKAENFKHLIEAIQYYRDERLRLNW